MLKEGITHTAEAVVLPSCTAKYMGSGSLEVFATPAMIAGMENTCMNCVQPYLEPSQTTVGTRVDISHLSATPVNCKITYSCTLVEIDRRRLVFSVQAFDTVGKIGEGTHERFIVDSARFMEKIADKN